VSGTGDERVVVTLDALAFGGDAVGREPSGRVVFVAGGAPGDRVEARLVERKRSFARGELVRVLEPGARVEPPCPLAGECGGCPWMHVAPEAQLAAKQAIVERALAKSGAPSSIVRQIAAAPQWLGYRVRARFTARGGRVGFQARRSHRVVDVERCLALAPPLDEALAQARRALGPLVGEGGWLYGRLGADGRVAIAAEAGEGADRRALGSRARELGVALDGGASWAAGFSQANAAQNDRLRALVEEGAELRGGERVLELYAGDGNFTTLLAARAHVTAVEGDRAAAARLDATLRALAPAAGFAVRAESAEAAASALAREGARFDVVVLDPPRTGAADALDAIAKLAIARVVYVSCDPMTLARDVARLAALGLRAEWAQPVDMMPHTSHVEVVMLLSASSPA
jgi:23S rRNA (uracil1939-C5)-methyltransferase